MYHAFCNTGQCYVLYCRQFPRKHKATNAKLVALSLLRPWLLCAWPDRLLSCLHGTPCRGSASLPHSAARHRLSPAECDPPGWPLLPCRQPGTLHRVGEQPGAPASSAASAHHSRAEQQCRAYYREQPGSALAVTHRQNKPHPSPGRCTQAAGRLLVALWAFTPPPALFRGCARFASQPVYTLEAVENCMPLTPGRQPWQCLTPEPGSPTHRLATWWPAAPEPQSLAVRDTKNAVYTPFWWKFPHRSAHFCNHFRCLICLAQLSGSGSPSPQVSRRASGASVA